MSQPPPILPWCYCPDLTSANPLFHLYWIPHVPRNSPNITEKKSAPSPYVLSTMDSVLNRQHHNLYNHYNLLHSTSLNNNIPQHYISLVHSLPDSDPTSPSINIQSYPRRQPNWKALTKETKSKQRLLTAEPSPPPQTSRIQPPVPAREPFQPQH